MVNVNAMFSDLRSIINDQMHHELYSSTSELDEILFSIH